MRIREWPSTERPREKTFAGGPGLLSDAELLALFLGSGLRGQDAVTTARHLLATHGSLRDLMARPVAALAELPGIGMARACLLVGALELGHRHYAADIDRGQSLTPESAGQLFARALRDKDAETFAALFLDARHRRIAFEELFHGTVDSAEVYPREVARRCLAHNAAAVIVGHNHPSGSAHPSDADVAVTRRLKHALVLIDVRLLDHIIVGDGPPVSLATRGRL
jgi:DNA repair protein RadC